MTGWLIVLFRTALVVQAGNESLEVAYSTQKTIDLG